MHEPTEPKGRLYLIRDKDTGRPLRLSRATTQAGALARATRPSR